MPESVRLRLADIFAAPTITFWLFPAATLKTGLEWPRTVTATVWVPPLLSAAPHKALFVPVTVIVPV